MDQLGDVILEKFLAVRLEARDHRASIGRIGAGQTEIQRIPAAARVERLQTVLGRAVLVLGKRLRIDDAQTDLAAGAGRDLLEKFAHPGRVRQDERRLLGSRFARKIEIQIDRFLDFREHLAGAGTQRVQPVLGQIEAHARQPEIRQHHHAQKQDGQCDQSAHPKTGSPPAAHHSAFFMSSTRAVAASQKMISAAKYTRSRKSMTPLDIASK